MHTKFRYEILNDNYRKKGFSNAISSLSFIADVNTAGEMENSQSDGSIWGGKTQTM